MTKNARWGQKSEGPVIMIAANSTKAHELFGGKTLQQVGQELDLEDGDVTFGYSTNPKTKQEIKSLMIKANGVKWQIPFSQGSNATELDSLDECMNWVFRTSFKSVKDAAGAAKLDENGKPVLADGLAGRELAPYMSLGRPTGLTIEREEAAFGEPVESKTEATVV